MLQRFLRKKSMPGRNEMTLSNIDESQPKAARVVGFAYLFAIVPAVFAEFYVLASTQT